MKRSKNKLLSPFIAVGLLVSAVFVLLQILPIPWQKRSEKEAIVTDSILPRVPPQDAGRIYHMLQTVDTLFKEKEIAYWMDGMTLLGAVRHKGIVPWESSSEIQVFHEDSKKIEEMQLDWEKVGLQLQEHPQGVRLTSLHNPSLYIDVTYVYRESDKILPKQSRVVWSVNDLFPLEEVVFGPLHLKCPKNPMGYLIELYGLDVMESASLPKEISSNKKNSRPRIQIEDFSSASFEMPDSEEPLLF